MLTKEQEFRTAQLDSLFREHEQSDAGKFLTVDFSAISKPADYYRAYDTVVARRHMQMTIGQLITFLEDLYSNEQKKLPKDTYFGGPAVSIIIDEVDQFLLGEENIRIFENIVEAGRGYFDHRILITQSPFQSTKNLRSTSTLLLGSNSIRRLDILDLEQWGCAVAVNNRTIIRYVK